MHNLRGASAQADRAEAVGQLYIINLSSANTPMSLEAPDLPELAGYAVFRSHRIEDGRDRYRLHLGYFDSQAQAQAMLPQLRGRYPAAWVALAPKDNMGSLDDTSIAQFRFIPRDKELSDGSAAPAVAVTPASTTAAEAELSPAASPSAMTSAAEQFLEPQQILTLLESPPRVFSPGAEEAPAPPAQPSASRLPSAPLLESKPAISGISVPQSFAVQLIWSTTKPDTRQISRLAIFDAYTMYTVTVQRAGRVWYGLRLGFFNDPISARQVALYVRSDYAAAAVVPVSERECGRANDAAKSIMQGKVEAKRPISPTAMAPLASKAAKSPAVKPSVNRGSRLPRKAAPTADQLMAELGASDLMLTNESENSFADTGVRHLSVAVVKPKRRLFFRT